MALVNQAKREINAKIVFFGPGLSGKATNLKHIHSKLKPEFRGALKAMNVQGARMIFFDFTPPGDGNVHGFKVRFHVYTVSGEQVEPSAWKTVLKGVDGVVFVADSAPERLPANQESLESLSGYLAGYGLSLATVPTVLQYNKCDLPGAFSQEELELALNAAGLPSFQGNGLTGAGVLQSLLSLVRSVLSGLRAKGGEEGAEALAAALEVPAPGHAGAPQPPEAPVEAPSTAGATAFAGFAEAAPQPQPAFEGAPSERVAAEEEEPLSLELSGAPQGDGLGRFRLPLTLRCGDRSKEVFLTISLSLEDQ